MSLESTETFEIRAMEPGQLAEFLSPAQAALGFPPMPERLEQLKTLPELALRLSAFADGHAVGAAGAYDLSLSVPGQRTVATSGLTMVGVLPTHRRRGILSRLVRHHFEEARRRGQPLAALFASEGSIYRRFGYGVASLAMEVEIAREHTRFVAEAPDTSRVTARLVDEDEAAATFPAIWDRVRARTPGMLARSEPWWRIRRIGDPPWIRAGRSPLQRVLLALGGQAVGYAIYRLIEPGWDGFNINTLSLDVTEAVGEGPTATAAVWRYLFELDLAQKLKARMLPVDHPLLFLLVEARRLRMRIADGLWLRLVDVEAALAARHYAAGPPLVLAIRDALCPWNQGCWRLDADKGRLQRTSLAPELELSVEVLGSVYLGGFRFSQLAAAGQVVEHCAGALQRADALFAAAPAPWSPEIF